MIWDLLFSVCLIWANDPLNNGIVIENISIDEPSIGLPSVDVSASQKNENFTAEPNNSKTQVQEKDSQSDTKDSGTSDVLGSAPYTGSTYLQPQDYEIEEENDESKNNEVSDEESQKKKRPRDLSP